MRALRSLVNKYSETGGHLQWQLGGPTTKISPWGWRPAAISSTVAMVEMIVAYFAPTWGLCGGLPGSASARAARGDHGRQVGQ